MRRGGYKVEARGKTDQTSRPARYPRMPDNKPNSRPDNRETENENLKPGSPPRPASEPKGSEGSSQTDKTLTDPATGEPN